MKFVVIIFQALAVAGGAFLGYSIKGGGGAPSHESSESHEAEAEKNDHGKKDDEKKKKDKREKKSKKKKDDGHGGGHGDSAGAENAGYLKFGRQFVVPVIARDNVDALVILDINLELDPSAAESAYSREPKVRDALLKSLLQLSNEGAFGERLLNEENLDDIRARLLASAKTVLDDDVVGVLILNVARQDV